MDTLKAYVSKWNVLNIILRTGSLKLLFSAFLVGLSFAIYSHLLGISTIQLTVKLFFPHMAPVTKGPIAAGYFHQLNYGIWYLLFCPFVFYITSYAAFLTDELTPARCNEALSFYKIGDIFWVSLVGLVILIFFLWKNIYVERSDYKHLGLGWVQSEFLQEKSKQVPFELKGRKATFKVKNESTCTYEIADTVVIQSISPNHLVVTSHIAFIVFIILVKAWVGLWEGLVVYFGLLVLIWGARLISLTSERSLNAIHEGVMDIRFVEKPFALIFFLGFFINLFSIFRYVANFNKGSYGKWDQYLSFSLYSPMLLVMVIIFIILHEINRHAPSFEFKKVLTKNVWICFTIWVSSLLPFVIMISEFFDESLHEECCAIFKDLLSFVK